MEHKYKFGPLKKKYLYGSNSLCLSELTTITLGKGSFNQAGCGTLVIPVQVQSQPRISSHIVSAHTHPHPKQGLQ